jgi:hypothetical protein
VNLSIVRLSIPATSASIVHAPGANELVTQRRVETSQQAMRVEFKCSSGTSVPGCRHLYCSDIHVGYSRASYNVFQLS